MSDGRVRAQSGSYAGDYCGAYGGGCRGRIGQGIGELDSMAVKRVDS